jgi:hypothetical protein
MSLKMGYEERDEELDCFCPESEGECYETQ